MGLSAEREQGITIDVAYRFFSTEHRKFIVADTPGHEQYTRNMVTGASTADVAVILVDARKGVLTQTRRHSFLVHLLGIKRVIVAINKMDLVGYSREVFGAIEQEYRDFAARIGLEEMTFIPLSALKGDNIVVPSADTPWYHGPTLLGFLETVPVDDDLAEQPFRMPVQWVNRPDLDFRGFSGRIVGGSIRPGDQIRVLPAGTTSTVERIVTMDGDLDEAIAGQSVTLTLTDEIDASRGDVICGRDDPAEVADQFEAHVVWMHEDEMLPGRPYLIKIGARTVGATISHPEVSRRRQQPRSARRDDARTQRDRRVQHQPRQADPVRPVRHETVTWVASSSSTSSPTSPSAPACSTSRCGARTTSIGRTCASTRPHGPGRTAISPQSCG